MRLFLLFLYTLSLAFTIPLFFPSFRVLYFVPFIVSCFYRSSLHQCLWWAFCCGLIVDLFSSHTRMGIYALNYCLTTFCLYRYKYHFFEDRLSTLPIMTFGFAFFSAILQVGIFYMTSSANLLTWEWIKNDLGWMPLRDALYAFLTFTLPGILFNRNWQSSRRLSKERKI